jgi:tRNA U34 5-methylaminomethyl-2-thiouridine-forming methyltransferase MnmC|tara:strand:+ start:67 stop:627 length:561 start_codon:yes stop_codon:yes gene_type:complete
VTNTNTAIIGHNEAPEEVTLEYIALGAFSSEKKSDAAVNSKEINFKLLLDRLTADGAKPGFNKQDEDDKTYSKHAIACRTAWVTSRGAAAVRAWESDEPTKAEKTLKSSLIKQVGTRMSKLSKALDRHQSGEKDKAKLTFTERLIKGIELAHYRLSQYEEDKHGEVTFNRRDVSSSLEKALKQLKG